VPSADHRGDHADFSFPLLVQAYFDCRRNKRNSESARAFEQHLEGNLRALYEELADGSYRPGPSICFIITRPKPREVWAAAFRDRIVHHLLYNRIGPAIERGFIANSCACIPGRGTLYAIQRLEAAVRSATQNWSRPVHYLKCDLANFFVSIDKRRLWAELEPRIERACGRGRSNALWRALAHGVLFHDPRQDADHRGAAHLRERVPPHKRLGEQPAHLGLPIGNLSSQFFANVYLNVLDQHAKHQLGARHYVRYVDDFVLLHESPQWLNAAHAEIAAFLPHRLGLRLNDSKTILQPAARGIDFVGQVLKPWRRATRRRTVHNALGRVQRAQSDKPAAELQIRANSYFGLLRQATASHHDRARLARAVRLAGYAVDMFLTKAYSSKRLDRRTP